MVLTKLVHGPEACIQELSAPSVSSGVVGRRLASSGLIWPHLASSGLGSLMWLRLSHLTSFNLNGFAAPDLNRVSQARLGEKLF